MLVRVGQKYGVDPRVLAIIARKESEFGTTSGKFKNNAWGWGVHLGPDVYTSRSWEEGASKVARGLAGNLYKGSGLTRIRDIIQRYAPPSENNTAQYIKQVEGWYRQMGGNPNASVFGNAATRHLDRTSPAASAASAATEVGATDQDAETSSNNGLTTSLASALAARQPGQSLFQAVKQGAMAAKISETLSPQAKADAERGDPTTLDARARRSGLNAGARGDAVLVEAAKRWLGTPYSWGGGTPEGPTRGFGRGANTVGFDCSSLVQHIWAKAGVKLPRTTYDQIKVGRAIKPDDMSKWKVGDLLFPHTGHVVMYIGNGKVVEAPRTGGHVQIVPARSSYMAVRRPRG